MRAPAVWRSCCMVSLPLALALAVAFLTAAALSGLRVHLLRFE